MRRAKTSSRAPQQRRARTAATSAADAEGDDDTRLRAFEVLFAPGSASASLVSRYRAWLGLDDQAPQGWEEMEGDER